MYIYKKPRYYDSEESDSDGGGACCCPPTNICPPNPDPNLQNLPYKVLLPPPNNNSLLHNTFIQDGLIDATDSIFEDIEVPDLGEDTPYGFNYDIATGWTFTYVIYITDSLQPTAGYNISDIETLATLVNPDGTVKSIVPPANTSYAKVPQYDTSIGQQSLAVAGNNLYVVTLENLDFLPTEAVSISVATTVTFEYTASPTCPTYEAVFQIDVGQDEKQCPDIPDPNLPPFNWKFLIPPPEWDTIVNDPTKIDGQLITGVSPVTESTSSSIPLSTISINKDIDGDNYGTTFDITTGYNFNFYFEFDNTALDLANYQIDTVQVVARTATSIIPDTNILIEYLPTYPYSWNSDTLDGPIIIGVSIILGTPIEIPFGGVYNVDFDVITTFEYIPSPTCPKYVVKHTGNITKTAIVNPVAEYKVRMGPAHNPNEDAWQIFPPFTDIPSCENYDIPGYRNYKYDLADPTTEYSDLYYMHNINQEWFDVNHPGFVPTIMKMTVWEKTPNPPDLYYTTLSNLVPDRETLRRPAPPNPDKAVPPNFLQTAENDGNLRQWTLYRLIEGTAADGTPIVSIPERNPYLYFNNDPIYSDPPVFFKSISWDLDPEGLFPPQFGGVTLLRWKWVPNGLRQMVVVMQYEWFDPILQQSVFHYTTKRVMKTGPTTTRSVIRTSPTTTIGELNLPTDVELPYALNFNATIKATTPNGSVPYELVTTPDTAVTTQFSQSPENKFAINFDNFVGGTVDYSALKDSEISFQLIETVTDLITGILQGTKTYNVIVQPPVPPRLAYSAGQQKFLIGSPNFGVLNSSGIGSYVKFNNNNQALYYVSQDSDTTKRPIVWVPFHKIQNDVSYTPRLQFAAAHNAQTTFNDPSIVTGVMVSPTGTTSALRYDVPSNNLVPNGNTTFHNTLPIGPQMVGFQLNNIPVNTGTNTAQFAIFELFASNWYKTTEPTVVTAASVFLSNTSGLTTTTAGLFQQTTASDLYAGTWKGLSTGQGFTYFQLPKTGMIDKSLAILMQGGIWHQSSTNVITNLFGPDLGSDSFAVCSLRDLIPIAETATTVTYSFAKQTGGQGLIRGFQWWPN